MQIDTIIQLVVLVVGFIAAIAKLQSQSKVSEERHKELQSGQSKIWGVLDAIRENATEVRTNLTAFEKLEDERHEKSDLAMDEMHGDLKRISREIHDVRLWQAKADQRMPSGAD